MMVKFLYENSVVWIHNETKTLATAGLRLDSNTFYIPISELEKLPKEEFEKQGEHKCDCKYVGCHVNDVKRWCHKKQAEILYEECNIECSEYLKQDEQKPTDYELTQKALFKKGDWITNGIDFTFQVISIKDNHYLRSDDYFIDIETVDKKFRLWTIQDAKDGDVLIVNNKVFIYAHRKQMYSIVVAHCFVDSVGGFYFDGEFGYTEKGNSIHPATKEQRDTLMKAMADAGYTFDFEKKELKKIKQNSTWSEEDETGLGDAMWAIEQARTIAKDENEMGNLWYAEKWLKSLKERYTWKPSEEQIIELHQAISGCSYDIEPLIEIEEYLKKLKEE